MTSSPGGTPVPPERRPPVPPMPDYGQHPTTGHHSLTGQPPTPSAPMPVPAPQAHTPAPQAWPGQQTWVGQPPPWAQAGPAGWAQQGPQPAAQPYRVPGRRPGGLTTAAVIGYLHGVLGVIASIYTLVQVSQSASSTAGFSDAPVIGSFLTAGAGVAAVLLVSEIAWTVIAFIGATRAMTGISGLLLTIALSVGLPVCVGVLTLLFAVVSTLSGFGAASSTDGASVTIVVLLGCLVAEIVALANLSTTPVKAYLSRRLRTP